MLGMLGLPFRRLDLSFTVTQLNANEGNAYEVTNTFLEEED